MHRITGEIAAHEGDIRNVDMLESDPEETRLYFEIDLPGSPTRYSKACSLCRASTKSRPPEHCGDLRKAYHYHRWRSASRSGSDRSDFEADRHNIRGEHISVDTIPLVGEQALADAVRAVINLPRTRALVLAGSLMGGEIVEAVKEVRESGLLVISLNMAGGVPDAADLVVTDPVQAGVMAVMAVADTAKFNVSRLTKRVF
ncbi:MAG: DUF5612 domain-containing protein [Bryobacteraceae bacterium]